MHKTKSERASGENSLPILTAAEWSWTNRAPFWNTNWMHWHGTCVYSVLYSNWVQCFANLFRSHLFTRAQYTHAHAHSLSSYTFIFSNIHFDAEAFCSTLCCATLILCCCCVALCEMHQHRFGYITLLLMFICLWLIGYAAALLRSIMYGCALASMCVHVYAHVLFIRFQRLI